MTMKEIDRIICTVMTDEQFDHLQDAQYDRWDLDARTAHNGQRRLARGLAQFGLTVADWDAWRSRD